MPSNTHSSMNVIEEVRKFVKEECKKANIFGDEIWYHILSVVEYAKVLAKKLNANQEIVEIAALLHDYASIKYGDKYEVHHILGAEEAEKILKGFNYPQEKIDIASMLIEQVNLLKEGQRKRIVSQMPMLWRISIIYHHCFILYLSERK